MAGRVRLTRRPRQNCRSALAPISVVATHNRAHGRRSGALAPSGRSMLTALSWDDDAHERGRKRRRRASTDLSFLRRHGSPRRDLERHRLWLRVREPRLRCLRRRRRVLAGHRSREVTRPRSGGWGTSDGAMSGPPMAVRIGAILTAARCDPRIHLTRRRGGGWFASRIRGRGS